jgi:NAD(P)-dependent dehydrogenase (short-subunit alcohol dehydrogenase family)
MDEEIWDEQMDVNVKSAFLTCKVVLPIMERQGGGSVVNISSIAGLLYVGKPQVAYAAAKAALMQLTRTTAVLYAARGIRLNCVVPGLMFTPLVQRLADKYAKGDFESFVAHRHSQVPTGRMGDAWDVAHTVLFLASDESKYITAQQIVVDGGLTATTR